MRLSIKKKYYMQLNYVIGSFKETYNELDNDNISFLLNIPYYKYINTAFKQFNASMDDRREIFFTKMKDAKLFANWLESYIIIDNLK